MKKRFLLLCCLTLLLAACSTPSNRTRQNGSARRTQAASAAPAASITPWPSPSETPLPTEPPTLTPIASPLGTATFGVGSSVMLAQDAICRRGPGLTYYEVLPYFAKDVLEVAGRNENGDWLMVRDSFNANDPVCWIPAAVLATVDSLEAVPLADYPSLPAVPTFISAPRSVCGVTSPALMVKWSPVAAGAQYRLYRNGELISTQSGDSYFDSNAPKPRRGMTYVYVLQTFNDDGNSPYTLSVIVAVCGK